MEGWEICALDNDGMAGDQGIRGGDDVERGGHDGGHGHGYQALRGDAHRDGRGRLGLGRGLGGSASGRVAEWGFMLCILPGVRRFFNVGIGVRDGGCAVGQGSASPILLPALRNHQDCRTTLDPTILCVLSSDAMSHLPNTWLGTGRRRGREDRPEPGRARRAAGRSM